MLTYNDTYKANLQKVRDAVAFKNEHMIPCYQGQSVPPTYTEGITLAEYMNDTDRGLKCYLDYMKKLSSEVPIVCNDLAYPGGHEIGLTIAWWSKVKMPGRELPPESVWQVDERQVIDDSDYDLILKEGSAGVQQRILNQFISPETFAEVAKFQKKTPEVQQAYVDLGLPVVGNFTMVINPFETLCGGRSMGKFFMDCYKQPDKIKAVQDVMIEEVVKGVLDTPTTDYEIGAWVGGWRSASNMVNQKIWDNLVWPYMKRCAEAVLEKGLIPIMHLDANWDRDIERFKELPKQKFIINTDGATDLRHARKVLGDHCALMGDVPSQMLTVSSPEEIKDYCRRLVDDIGPEGFFLTPGCDAPSCSKYENLVAIYEVAAEY